MRLPHLMRRLAESPAGRVVLSAVLLLLAFAPANLHLLAFVALVPWLGVLRDSTPREAWRRGYGFGFIFSLGQLYWLGTLTARWTESLPLGLVPWLLSSTMMAVYFGLAGWLIQRCWAREWMWAIPFVWAGIEAFRAYIPVLAFPWGFLANPLWPYPPLIQTAHYGSIVLVSAWIVTGSVALTLWLGATETTRSRRFAGVFVAGLVVSLAHYSSSMATSIKVVTIGQPGVDMAFDREADAKIGPAVDQLISAARVHEASLLVLPEGIARGGDRLPPATPFRIDSRVPILFGGQRGSGPVYQSAFAYDGRWQSADKTRLVIFGEFVPGRDVLPFLGAFHLPTGDLSAGDRLTALDVNGTRVGPIICFEALFPDLAFRQAVAGSRMIAIMSIDDWFQGTIAPDQLRSAAIWRAVETGLPVVRSATLGHSLAIDGHGQVLAEAQYGKPVAMRVELPVPTDSPVFPALPAFPLVSVLVALAVVLGVRRPGRPQS